MNKTRRIVWATIFILLVTAIGLSVVLQGWKSRHVNFDLLPYIDNAREFITLGQIPQKGTLTSFGSYTPPGITWLMIPGAAIFNDPRLFESLGCALLYVGTLLGIFLLARVYFGTACAYLAAGLWGLSELGLLFAQSSWARSHPFFYVWMVYWLGKWVERNNTWYLAASITTWAIGMYVFLEMAPALFIVPVVWIVYRPSIRIAPLFVAAVVVAIVWYPYLSFESNRNFADLKSQVFRQNVRLINFKDFWCNPALFPESWKTASAWTEIKPVEASRTLNSSSWKIASYTLLGRANLILDDLLIVNFSHTAPIPGTSLLLLLMTMASLLVLSIQAFVVPGRKIGDDQAVWANALKWLGLSALIVAALINEFTIARYLSLDGILEPPSVLSVRRSQLLVAIVGVALLALRNHLAVILGRIPIVVRGVIQEARPARKTKVIVISLLVPWLILLSMTEVYRLERFWWLWPLQIVVLASAVTYLPLQFKLPNVVAWIGSFVLLLMVAGNGLVLSRLTAWVRDGWSGSDAREIEVVDYVARQIGSKEHQAAIGYNLFIYQFMPVFHAVDARYKVGADFDLLFKYRHGIVNTNRCAEGVSYEDKYRIVQTSTNATDEGARQHIDIPQDDSFHLSHQVGAYQVFQRP